MGILAAWGMIPGMRSDTFSSFRQNTVLALDRLMDAIAQAYGFLGNLGRGAHHPKKPLCLKNTRSPYGIPCNASERNPRQSTSILFTIMRLGY